MTELNIGIAGHTAIYTEDEPGFGGANHKYIIVERISKAFLTSIRFQKGPIEEHVANGVPDEDLIKICIHRLQSFQAGDFKCRENAIALTRLEDALHWLDHRTRDRQKRGVEGKYEK